MYNTEIYVKNEVNSSVLDSLSVHVNFERNDLKLKKKLMFSINKSLYF